MEYGKKDWQRSEGQYRSLGRENMEKNRQLSAYHPSEREKTEENRPNEMLTMESSYGGIALGASKNKKMKMVVHEKRRSRGPGLKKDNKEIEGSRTARISELRGDFRTNSHSRTDSALAYEENTEETPLRMMERLQEMMDENIQQSAEKVLPFLNRKEDEARRKEIQEKLRESQEKGDRAGYGLWSRRQEDFRREGTEKEQMRRKFYRELTFAREKAKKLMKEDALHQNVIFEALSGQSQEDGAGEELPGTPPEVVSGTPKAGIKDIQKKQKKKEQKDKAQKD